MFLTNNFVIFKGVLVMEMRKKCMSPVTVFCSWFFNNLQIKFVKVRPIFTWGANVFNLYNNILVFRFLTVHKNNTWNFFDIFNNFFIVFRILFILIWVGLDHWGQNNFNYFENELLFKQKSFANPRICLVAFLLRDQKKSYRKKYPNFEGIKLKGVC